MLSDVVHKKASGQGTNCKDGNEDRRAQKEDTGGESREARSLMQPIARQLGALWSMHRLSSDRAVACSARDTRVLLVMGMAAHVSPLPFSTSRSGDNRWAD